MQREMRCLKGSGQKRGMRGRRFFNNTSFNNSSQSSSCVPLSCWLGGREKEMKKEKREGGWEEIIEKERDEEIKKG